MEIDTRKPVVPPDVPIVVPLSRVKVVTALVAALAFVLLGLVFVFQPGSFDGSKVFLRVLGGVTVLFCGACVGVAASKLGDRAPGLVVDSEGFEDNSSALAAGRVHWREVLGLGVTSVQRQKFLTVYVEDPERFIARAGPLRRKLIRANERLYGSPVHISANSLRIPFAELEDLMLDAFERFGSGSESARSEPPD